MNIVIYLFIYLSIHLFIYLFIYLIIYLSSHWERVLAVDPQGSILRPLLLNYFINDII